MERCAANTYIVTIKLTIKNVNHFSFFVVSRLMYVMIRNIRVRPASPI